MTTVDPCALLITGAVGVGKTTVAGAVGTLLEQRGIPGAVIDLDELRRCWPTPPGDGFHHRLELRNLRAVAAGYREAGARVLVAAGVLEGRAARADYQDALVHPVTVVRLTVPRDLARHRLRHRHRDDPDALAWHLDRFDELTAILDRAHVEDLQVPVEGTPVATASAVLAALGIRA